MATLDEVRQIVGDILQLGSRVSAFDEQTQLLGNLPEFDSMAVVNLITALEEQYGFTVDDDEISAEVFETLGSLTDFVDKKLTT